MVALIESMTVKHPALPVLVLSNRPDAIGLDKAAALGVQTAVVDHRPFSGDREAFEAALIERLDLAEADIICLAGFMRILTPVFITRWQGRILNIHPSLLPKYKGLNTHARAISAGDSEAGCSVHTVTGELDGGPVLGQARLPVRPADTAKTLAARILPLEHKLYPAVLQRFAQGDDRVVSL